MTFLNAAFVFGALSIAVPIVIHLIYRQRYPDRHFTTLRFFDKTLKHNVIQRKLIDRILLALRVLALLVLMFGLARPFFPSSSGIGEHRRSVVIVLDNSPSMSRMRDGKTLFDRAKAAAVAVLDQLQTNSGSGNACDEAEVIFTAGGSTPAYSSDKSTIRKELDARAGQLLALLARTPTTSAEAVSRAYSLSLPEFTTDKTKLQSAIDRAPAGIELALVSSQPAESQLNYDLTRVRSTLDGARVSALPGKMSESISMAAKALRASKNGDRRIVILTDLQKSDWQGGDLAGLDGLSVTLGAIDAPDSGSNLAIENVSPSVREAVLGQSVMCTATVRNYGNIASSEATLSIIAGDRGRAIETKVAALPPNTSTLVSFPITVMTRERNLLCTATIRSAADSFEYDNTWHFQIGVRPPVTTLCVNGAPASSVSDRETFFVMNALAPRPAAGAASGGQGENLVDARECEVADLKNQQLFQYGVVVLCGVRTLDSDTREKLRRFVTDGGGLIIFPGSQAVLDDYNAWGFLPAKLLERKTADFAYVKSIAEESPALDGVKQRIGAGINALSSNSWIMLEPDMQPGTSVLATLSSSAPALVQGRVGKGSVLLFATGCHVNDSDWPLRPAFVILTRSLVKFLGAPAISLALDPYRQTGEGASTSIPANLVGGTPALFHVQQNEKNTSFNSLPWTRNEAGSSILFPGAESPGHYLLSVQPSIADGLLKEPGLGSITRPISVHHSSGESALESMPMKDAGLFLPGAKLTAKRLPDNADEAGAAILADNETGRDFWRWLMGAALVFLLIESVLAGRTSSESNA